MGLGDEGWGLLRDTTRVQILEPRSGAEKGFYKGPTKIGNNISAAAVLKCSSQNQTVRMKLNVFFFTVFLRKTRSHFVVASTLGQNGTTGQGNGFCVLG